jgi:beta-N-acetylhexosaminidase
VQRLAGNVGLKRRLSERAVAARFTPEQAYDYYLGMARDIKSFGFNVNLGPVVDVNTNPRNPIIGRHGRAFSPDPQTVAKYGAAFVRAHRDEGIITSLKHFPGHGSGSTDSHLEMVDISRSWNEKELAPFAQLIAENLADTVMVGHLHVAGLQQGEAAKLPATFSPALLEGILRGQLRFEGVIISDDLEMGAIHRYYQPGDALVRAIKAGNDLLILSNTHKPDPNMPARALASIRQAAEQDPELKGRIVVAYNRIIALKQRYLGPKSRASAN